MNQYSNEQQPKIFIAGTSWARGEWQGPRLVHKGLEQYFIDDGYTVINSSRPRSTHAEVNLYLDKSLSQYYKDGDIILWIQADPLSTIIGPNRDKNNKLSNLSQALQNTGSLSKLIADQKKVIFTELNQTALKYKTTILCIGGPYNISSAIEDYSNLKSLIPSWIYLLVGHLQDYNHTADPEFGMILNWSIEQIDFSQCNNNLSISISQEIGERISNSKLTREDIFHPDGVHPNRHGHRILYDCVVDKLNLQKLA
jgi:hypothetical protein